jgi:glycosyltransferase involved in cell wall biosynthesis
MFRCVRGVILAPHPHTQGAVPRIAAWLASGLTESGWSVEVWPWGKREDGEILSSKVISRALDAVGIGRRLRSLGGVDFVVVKSGLDWKSVLRDLLLVSCVRKSVPAIILQPHGSQVERLSSPRGRLFKCAAAALLAHVDAVFLLSTEEIQAVEGFAPRTNAYLVRNPYDPGCLDSTPVSVHEGRLNVLFVGRMVREKGVLDLVAAAADSDGRGVLDITFVGRGPAEDEVNELVETLGLGDTVHLRGLGDARALRDAYLGADVLALPSYSEGFPTVLAEAMGFGLPIVCTAIRGAVDHLTDGVHAIFVQPKDSAGLRRALLRLRDDAELRRRMSRSNLSRVQRFDPAVVARHYGECIMDVIAKKPREAGASS